MAQYLVVHTAHRGGTISEQVTVELLKAFPDAFNRHDLDAIMDYFADECVFYMPRGASPRGDRYVGKDDVIVPAHDSALIRVAALAGAPHYGQVRVYYVTPLHEVIERIAGIRDVAIPQ